VTTVLVVTRGHRYDYNGFHAMFDENPALNATFVDQPAAQISCGRNVALRPCCFIDMWGLPGWLVSSDPAPPEFARSIEALLEAARPGLLNHALAGCRNGHYGASCQGRLCLTASVIDGREVPASGFRCDGYGGPERTLLRFIALSRHSGHPVVAGLEEVRIRTSSICACDGGERDIVSTVASDFHSLRTISTFAVDRGTAGSNGPTPRQRCHRLGQARPQQPDRRGEPALPGGLRQSLVPRCCQCDAWVASDQARAARRRLCILQSAGLT